MSELLIDAIKARSIDARKAGRKVEGSILTTLYSEAAMVGKNNGNRSSTDEEVIKVVRKFYNNNEETLRLTGKSDAKIYEEQAVLNSLLPQQLTDEQIQEAIDHVGQVQPLSMKSMSFIKSRIDSLYPGSYDGKRVSEVLKNKLS